ncbi:MAG: hypothetical protein R3301_04385, partial [Saprospiraceae bacterium]|nr:hypothetical protein [Saprospiraceae bacterium]
MDINTLQLFIILGGIGHFVLVAGSLFIPQLMDWRGKLRNVHSHIRQMFWTYAGYILAIHVFFGLISVLATEELTSPNPLSIGFNAFVTLYWLVRIILQFTIYDKKDLPNASRFRIGEAVLVSAFAGFVVLYGTVTW